MIGSKMYTIQVIVSLLLGSMFTVSAESEVTDLNNANSHQNIVIDDRPGIYYERVSQLRLRHADWRISVFIELQQFIDGFPRMDGKIHNALITCENLNPREKCRELLRQDYINERVNTARVALRELKKVAFASELIDPRESPPLRTMKRRSVPLGVIGSISKSLFGTMDQEDAEYINGQIDRLFADQANLTYLIGKQMHITTSRLQQLQEEHVKESKRIDDLHMRLRDVKKQLAQFTEETRRIMYNGEVVLYTHHVEQKLDQYIKTCEEYTKVIVSARDGRYEPAILTTDQLSTISREIQLHAPEFEFPLPIESLRGETLARLADVDVVYHDGKIIVMVHLPLLGREVYHMYRIHPWPVPQEGNRSLSAHISPAVPYIALSANRRTYFTVDNAYVQACRHLERKYICPVENPLHEVETSEQCEIAMLVRPSLKAYRRCNVRLCKQYEAFWKHLPTQGGWLYSLVAPEDVHVACPGLAETTVTLHQAGVFHLSANCVARTRTTTLTGTRIYQGQNQYFYAPEISLSVTLVAPNISAYLASTHESAEEKPETDNTDLHWKDDGDGESLSDIERKIGEIGKHRREKRTQEYYTYGGYAAQVLIILLILGYGGWKISRLMTKRDVSSKRKSGKERPPNSRESYIRRSMRKYRLRKKKPEEKPEELDDLEIETVTAAPRAIGTGTLPRQVDRIDNY